MCIFAQSQTRGVQRRSPKDNYFFRELPGSDAERGQKFNRPKQKQKTEGALLLTGWEATPPMRRGSRAPPRCRRSAPPPPRPPPPPSPAARRPRRCPSPGTTTSCTAPAAAASARSGTGAADPPNAGRRRPCVCGLIDRQQEGEETPSLVVVVGLRRRSDFK